MILLSPHFQNTKRLNDLVMMKWTWKWWGNEFSYQSHAFHILFYFLYFSSLSYFIFFSQLRKVIYQDCKQHVGAGINALMSNSDGLGLAIFCRKMEKARPMMEEMDGKVVYFPPESAFLKCMKIQDTIFIFWWSTDDNNPVPLNFLHSIICNC